MLRNYLITAIRNMFRDGGYSAINIIGLAVGMAVCILIVTWIADEVSYDRFHVNADRIYICYKQSDSDINARVNYAVSGPVGPYTKENIPGVVDYARLGRQDLNLRHGGKIVTAMGICVDPAFLSMFSFPLIAGDDQNALSTVNSIVLTRKTATAIFGDQEALGKTLDNGLTVTGIAENIPDNSHLDFDFLVPLAYAEQTGLVVLDDWWLHQLSTYLLLSENARGADVDLKITNVLKDYDPEFDAEVHLQPLTEIHLGSLEGGGPITYVYVFGCVAILILVVACMNFVNLTTARSMKRAKEIALRKTVGAGRLQLVQQIFVECLGTVAIALVLTVALVEFSLPLFNDLSGKQLDPNVPEMAVLLVAVALTAGLLAGSYPALLLSSFNPAVCLKRTSQQGDFWGPQMLRRGLVVFQFSLSIFLVLGTAVIRSQLEYVETKDLGIDRENIVCVKVEALDRDYQMIREELSGQPGVLNVTAAFQPPYYSSHSICGFDFEGKHDGQDIRVDMAIVDYDYVEVFGLGLIQGRSFSREFPSDETEGIIVNESAARAMGMSDPIGKTINVSRPRKIIGVVKDFHLESLHSGINPLLLLMERTELRYLCIKIDERDLSGILSALKKKWQELRPGEELTYRWFSDMIGGEYRSEKQARAIVESFTLLTVFIAGMGLFGLATCSAEQRRKEIGIRKVLGASISSVTGLMLSEVMVLVAIAAAVALPVASYVTNLWLEGFAYQVTVGWSLYLLSGLSVLGFALAVVGYQTFRAARANPVEALRYE